MRPRRVSQRLARNRGRGTFDINPDAVDDGKVRGCRLTPKEQAMAFTVQPDSFRFEQEFRTGVAGKRVLITGAGKDGGLGQSFALAAGLNGAAAVGVHFHRSYADGFDLVAALQEAGVAAFPVQADVTSMGDLWATRSYVIDQFGGLPPNLIICNSGLTEKGYSFGRALREVDGESMAQR